MLVRYPVCVCSLMGATFSPTAPKACPRGRQADNPRADMTPCAYRNTTPASLWLLGNHVLVVRVVRKVGPGCRSVLPQRGGQTTHHTIPQHNKLARGVPVGYFCPEPGGEHGGVRFRVTTLARQPGISNPTQNEENTLRVSIPSNY